jgi:hypothetical protein
MVPKKKHLKPEDFPVHTEQTEIVTDTGKPIAGARDKEIAEDVADRLNSDHTKRNRIAGLNRAIGSFPKAPEDFMSDEDDWDFAGADDAKMTIRAALNYLLRGTSDGVRGDILQAIISIVRQVAAELPLKQPNSLDDGIPGG